MIRVDSKRWFFDGAAVRARVSSASRRVLSRIGAYVRQRARTSIRPGERPSIPGFPPHSHTGLLRRFIWFAYEPRFDSVVIGPVKLNHRISETALTALEYGGWSVSTSGLRGRRRRRVYIQARPFMRPALEAEEKNFAPLWRGSISP